MIDGRGWGNPIIYVVTAVIASYGYIQKKTLFIGAELKSLRIVSEYVV